MNLTPDEKKVMMHALNFLMANMEDCVTLHEEATGLSCETIRRNTESIQGKIMLENLSLHLQKQKPVVA